MRKTIAGTRFMQSSLLAERIWRRQQYGEKFGPWQTNHGQSWSDSEQKYNFSFLILKINICIVNKDVNRNQTCFYWVKKIINGRYSIYLGLRKKCKFIYSNDYFSFKSNNNNNNDKSNSFTSTDDESL